jgi:hypothetical protein
VSGSPITLRIQADRRGERESLAGFLVSHNSVHLPQFLVGVDSKQFNFHLTLVESTLAGTFVTVDSRGLAVHQGGATLGVFASVECKALGLSKLVPESKNANQQTGVRGHKA